eukprot:TRINITY_DN30800_c0_g1_i2.p2 TRINITY_DN30800_c0_g1~~TRINITY_DN30800_c0_g1_i2.p2  ORF type:complete len:291 (+),score=25.70 TRINITY_DN30800_c0_g1_i2:61-933(+)
MPAHRDVDADDSRRKGKGRGAATTPTASELERARSRSPLREFPDDVYDPHLPSDDEYDPDLRTGLPKPAVPWHPLFGFGSECGDEGAAKDEEMNDQGLKSTKKTQTLAILGKRVDLLTRAYLAQMAMMRDLMAAVFYVYLIPTQNSVASRMTKTIVKYLQAKDRSNLGTPHLQLFGALLTGLERQSTTGAEQKLVIKSYMERVLLKLPIVQLREEIRFIRIKQCYEKAQSKINISFSVQAENVHASEPMSLAMAIRTSLRSLGSQEMTGPPPRGALERQLVKWIGQQKKS